jgi:hypothetical protein
MRVRHRVAVSVAALVATGSTAASVAGAAPARAQEPAAQPGQAYPVALLTGPGSINATDVRYQVKATDLGIMWRDEQGRILTAFGDTFGAGWTGPGSGAGDPATLDWRSNTLARSTDPEPGDGLTFDDFVTDRPGHAAELIPSLKQDHVEISTIPTGGVNVDARDYLAYMSVRHFGPPGRWTTNHSGIAYSADGGQTWVEALGARRPNTPSFDDPFQMIAFARRDGLLYAFGTPNGRFGDAYVARVPEDRLLDPSGYEYWTGTGWRAGPATLARPVVDGPVGELSVRYDETLRLWVMSYLDEALGSIVLRLAPAPTGPWGPELAVASASTYPTLYGGFQHPHSRGTEIYFTMTRFDPYNVSLMRVELPGDLVATARTQLPSTLSVPPES